METITLTRGDAGTSFLRGTRLLGTACAAPGCRDHFIPLGDGVFRWERTCDQSVDRLVMRLEAPYEMAFQMAPAAMYDGNTEPSIIDRNRVRRIINHEPEEGAEPCYFKSCFDEKTGKPWRLAWWYTSIPGATYSEGGDLSCAMFFPPDQMDGAASVYPQGETTVHEAVWPEQTTPRCPGEVFQGELIEPAGIRGKPFSGIVAPWRDGGLTMQMEKRCYFAVILVFEPVTRPRTAWHRMEQEAWTLYRKTPTPKFSDRELWDMSLSFCKSLYGSDDTGFEGFTFGMMWIDGAWRPRNQYRYELGWCGQSVSQATSMLVHAFLTGDREAERMGFTCLDSWISRTLPHGLLPTHLEEQEYTYFGRRTLDACNLCHGVIQFLFAWRMAQLLGKYKPEYREAALRICDFAVSQMDAEGKIGKSWAEDDLTPLVRDGTSGSFLTLALCEAARCTGEKRYLEAAIRSYAFYYEKFIRRGYAMGGALDIFTIDKESAMPLLSAGLLLHELTQEKKYITFAEDAAWYLSTWQWCYSRRFRKGSALDLTRYDSYGGTAVSIHDPGNDPYALFFVQDLYDLAELTGNPMWAERAHAAWVNGADGISDGTLVVDGRPTPYGGQHEARFMEETYHGVFHWLVAWPSAFRLVNLRRTLPVIGDRPGRRL